MFTLRIDHSVPDYEAWKAAFDRDPVDRKGSGVRSYRVARSVTDPNRVLIDLDVADLDSAEGLLVKLQGLWAGPAAAITINPMGMITETVDTVDL